MIPCPELKSTPPFVLTNITKMELKPISFSLFLNAFCVFFSLFFHHIFPLFIIRPIFIMLFFPSWSLRFSAFFELKTTQINTNILLVFCLQAMKKLHFQASM